MNTADNERVLYISHFDAEFVSFPNLHSTMESRTMSLRQTLLYFLSLSSISFANQDVFQDSDRDIGLDAFPSPHRVLATKTVTYNEQTPVPPQSKYSPNIDTLSLQTN